jgi:hypothetical protein
VFEIKLIARGIALKVIADLKENIRTKAPTSYGAMNNTGQAMNSLNYRWEGDRLDYLFGNIAFQLHHDFGVWPRADKERCCPKQPNIAGGDFVLDAIARYQSSRHNAREPKLFNSAKDT